MMRVKRPRESTASNGNEKRRNLTPEKIDEAELQDFLEGALSDGTCEVEEANGSPPSIDQQAYT